VDHVWQGQLGAHRRKDKRNDVFFLWTVWTDTKVGLNADTYAINGLHGLKASSPCDLVWRNGQLVADEIHVFWEPEMRTVQLGWDKIVRDLHVLDCWSFRRVDRYPGENDQVDVAINAHLVTGRIESKLVGTCDSERRYRYRKGSAAKNTHGG
jgi:hypothetical protein